MKKNKVKKPAWVDVKKHIGRLDKERLVELVETLYCLSAANKDFFHARYLSGRSSLESYKRIIAKAMHPYLEDGEVVDMAKAAEAIRHYALAVGDPDGTIELMIHSAECGTDFTLTYGDIDGDFYNSLLELYENAAETVAEFPAEEREKFRAPLRKIMDSASGIGWGYHDGLSELYRKAFPDKE